MGRPLHTPERQCGTGLVAGYIEYVGTREPDNVTAIRNSSPDNPYNASLVIGAACLLLIHGMDREADIGLRSVRDRMHAFTHGKGRYSTLGPDAAQLKLIATMLLHRDEADAAHQFQIASHAESIEDLKRLRPIYRKHLRQSGRCPLAGTVGEQALNSLLTRCAGPATIATPTLLHHNHGARLYDNADHLVVNQGALSSPPTVQRAQLKQQCFGYCGNQEGEVHDEEERPKYMEDVVLISGHCDVIDPQSGQSLNGLGKRLMLEARGEASPAQIEMLDEATLHMLQTITDPESWRMGTRPMAKSMAYSFG